MALKIDIYPKNIELSDKTREFVEKKISRLDRYMPDIEETRVDLQYQRSMRNPADRQVAEITLRGRGYILRSEERADDLLTAIDMAVEKIQRKIERFKGKRVRGRGDGTPTGQGVADEVDAAEVGAESPRIARRKSFALTPMDEEEALDQMAALGHENFFIFYNTSTESINVIYARRDGTFGLIEPRMR